MTDNHDLRGHYTYHAARHDHKYGEIISSVRIEDIFEQIDSEHLIEGLTDFLLDNSERTVDRERKKREAEALLNGEKGEKILIESLSSAIEQGYVWKFRLEKPWHPKAFMDGEKLTTFPFQHKFIVGYSGKPKHIFFSKKGKEYVREKSNLSQFFNPESILVQGRINASSNHADAKEGNKVNNETMDIAIWFSCLKEAKKYPLGQGLADRVAANGAGVKDKGEIVYSDNVVLEVCVPSNFVVQHNTYERWENLVQTKEKFGSPMEYQASMKKYWDNTDGMDFKIALKEEQDSGGSFLPLKYIRGVWDKEEFPRSPYFMALDNYVAFLYEEYPRRMPQQSRINFSVPESAHDVEKQQKALRKLKEIKKRSITVISTYEDQFSRVKKIVESIRDYSEKISSQKSLSSFRALNRNLNRLTTGDGRSIVAPKKKGLEKEFEVKINSPTYSLKKAILGELENKEASRMAEKCNKFEKYIFDKEKEIYEKIEQGDDVNLDRFEKGILKTIKEELSETPVINYSDSDLKFLTEFLVEELGINREDIGVVDGEIKLKQAQ